MELFSTKWRSEYGGPVINFCFMCLMRGRIYYSARNKTIAKYEAAPECQGNLIKGKRDFFSFVAHPRIAGRLVRSVNTCATLSPLYILRTSFEKFNHFHSSPARLPLLSRAIISLHRGRTVYRERTTKTRISMQLIIRFARGNIRY